MNDSPARPKTVAVLGGGGDGHLLREADRGERPTALRLWVRNPEHAAALRETRENRRLLPGVTLPDGLTVTADAAEAAAGADRLLIAVPTKYLRECLSGLARRLPAGLPAVSVVKGIEFGTFKRPSEVVRETLGARPVTALGGPCHAEEAANRLPASVVAASDDCDGDGAGDCAAVQALMNSGPLPGLHERRPDRRGTGRGAEERDRGRRRDSATGWGWGTTRKAP